MFIGRERELESLNRLYTSDKFEFAVIYGRRRVGKTALINEFIKDKKAIYFMGVESNEKQNLENLWAWKVMKNRILRISAEIFWSIKQGFRQIQPFLHFRRLLSMCLSWLKMRG